MTSQEWVVESPRDTMRANQWGYYSETSSGDWYQWNFGKPHRRFTLEVCIACVREAMEHEYWDEVDQQLTRIRNVNTGEIIPACIL